MTNLLFGYNTNGFAYHSLLDALEIICALGYKSVALTIDVHSLNPFDKEIDNNIKIVKSKLDEHSLVCVIETGARYILNPWKKHYPTLLEDSDDKIRYNFLIKCMDIAKSLGSSIVSFWSGALPEGLSRENGIDKIVNSCKELVIEADKRNLKLALEPEPDMLISTISDFLVVKQAVSSPTLGLTLDVGHLYCNDEGDFREIVSKVKNCVYNIHIEDANIRRHEHLFFGDGIIDFDYVLYVLREFNIKAPLNVELSSHSRDVVNVAKASLDFLRSKS